MRPTTKLTARLFCSAVAVAGGLLAVDACAAAANAATPSSSAQARYQKDRANCLAGKTDEDRKTCLKEAGAREQAAREGMLTTPTPAQAAANERRRCDPLKGDDKQACLAMAAGQGNTSGSVAGGGELHEYTQIIPGKPAKASGQ